MHGVPYVDVKERERRVERVQAGCKFLGIKKLRKSNKWIIDEPIAI